MVSINNYKVIFKEKESDVKECTLLKGDLPLAKEVVRGMDCIGEVELIDSYKNFNELHKLLKLIDNIVYELGERFELATRFRVYMDSYEECCKFLTFLLIHLDELSKNCNDMAKTSNGCYYIVVQLGGVMKYMNKEDYTSITYKCLNTKTKSREEALTILEGYKNDLISNGEAIAGVCLFNSDFDFNLSVEDYISIYK